MRELEGTEVYRAGGEDKVLEGEDFRRFKIWQALEFALQIVGVKPDNYPNSMHKNLIAKNVLQDFGYLTLEEITRAFELAGKGTLQVDIAHYQQVTIQYVFTILNAYKVYRHGEMEKLEKRSRKSEKEVILENRKTNSDAIKAMMFKAYLAVVDDEDHSLILSASHYDYLEYMGLIELNTNQKKYWMGQAKGKLTKERSTLTERLFRKRLKELTGNEVKDEAKKLAVISLYKNHVKDCGRFADATMAFKKWFDEISLIDVAEYRRLL